MRITVCDICGRTPLEVNMIQYKMKEKAYRSWRRVDICEDCFDKIRTEMHKADTSTKADFTTSNTPSLIKTIYYPNRVTGVVDEFQISGLEKICGYVWAAVVKEQSRYFSLDTLGTLWFLTYEEAAKELNNEGAKDVN